MKDFFKLDCDLILQRLVLRAEALKRTGARGKTLIRKSFLIRQAASGPSRGTGLLR